MRENIKMWENSLLEVVDGDGGTGEVGGVAAVARKTKKIA